jgi:hypothetical protein
VVRWARALLVGCSTVGLSTAAHVAADGRRPAAWVVLVAAVAVSRVCLPFTARRLGTGFLVAVMAGVQLGLHLVFSLLEDGLAAAGAPSGAAMDGMTHGVAFAPPGHTLRMLTAHAVVAVVVVAWLRAGEGLLWRAATRTVALSTRVARAVLDGLLGVLHVRAVAVPSPVGRPPARSAVRPSCLLVMRRLTPATARACRRDVGPVRTPRRPEPPADGVALPSAPPPIRRVPACGRPDVPAALRPLETT